MKRLCFRLLCVVLVLLGGVWPARAGSFDLSGPTLEATVTRGKARLPIAEVPNLQAGDRVWIQANLPRSQSVRYLMVVVFLRGATNPPPDKWFHRDETWKARGSEGLRLTVPKGARQMLVLLAPETGGAYHTLKNAVEHKPGSFVRASQDLNEATLDRSRLDTYISAIRRVNASDPGKLHRVAPMLARSLSIKLNNTCFDAVSDEQAPCLMHNQNSLVMNDSQSASITDTLTSGPVSNLAMQVSATPKAGFGYYSPYIASVMDMARVMEQFHNPHYQYIPALALPKGKAMHLMLNTPPSFGKQKSVIVAAMPAVQAPQMPLLHAAQQKRNACAEQTGLVLPADGAPLVFATSYAHDMKLRLRTKRGKVVSLPAHADPEKGGFVIDTKGLDPKQFGDTVEASLDGLWGFQPYHGPEFTLENAHPQPWTPAPGAAGNLVVGRNDVLDLNAGNAACVRSIAMRNGQTGEIKTQWKRMTPRQVQVTLPLKQAKPGALTLVVHQYGFDQPETVTLRAFARPPRLKGFTLHAGDRRGVLKGNRLDEVASLEVNGAQFAAANTDEDDDGTLRMTATGKKYKTLAQGSAEAHVRLRDGRLMTVATRIEAPRPVVKLLARSVEHARRAHSHIQLADGKELPQTATLRFSVKAVTPVRFNRGEALEVATADKVFTTTLTLGNGGLTLQDLHTAVATLHPAKAFGPSAFGPLQFRVVDHGVAGKWQPLAMLVRLPKLQVLKCKAARGAADSADPKGEPCELKGENLFLVDAVASDPGFQNAVQVPDGFPGDTLKVPHPAAGQLYVKLRDDPTAVNIVALRSKRVHRAAEAKGAKLPFQPGGPMIPAKGRKPVVASAKGAGAKAAAGKTAAGGAKGVAKPGRAAAQVGKALKEPGKKSGKAKSAEQAATKPKKGAAAVKQGVPAPGTAVEESLKSVEQSAGKQKKPNTLPGPKQAGTAQSESSKKGQQPKKPGSSGG